MEALELLKKKNQSLEHLEKYEKLKLEAENNCNHPSEYLIQEEKHYEAGYDYVSESVYWDLCTICLAKINKKTRFGNYFG